MRDIQGIIIALLKQISEKYTMKQLIRLKVTIVKNPSNSLKKCQIIIRHNKFQILKEGHLKVSFVTSLKIKF